MVGGISVREVHMTRTSALFIDFDNFFGGLMDADPAAALDVVTKPSTWLARLTRDDEGQSLRRWLLLRCYMNPAGSIPNPTDAGKRLRFSEFRPYFTQAGIEVVDCPSLTKRAKNGADIRIAVDVMTYLRADTRYDEIVLASSDADFTPLLQVVRAHDRLVTIVSTGNSTVSYEALADELLDEQDVIELTHPAGRAQGNVEWEEAERERFVSIVQSEYAESNDPLNLARLASRLKMDLGDVVTRTAWFGSGSFVIALRALELPNAEFSQHHLWDSTRHAAPSQGAQPPADALAPEIPPVIAKFRQVTKLPALATGNWVQVYESLAAYACLHEFNFTESTRWARDHAAEAGHDIGRQAFTFVVRSCNAAGAPLYAEQPPTEQQIGAALLTNVLNLARESGVDITEDDSKALATWLGVATT